MSILRFALDDVMEEAEKARRMYLSGARIQIEHAGEVDPVSGESRVVQDGERGNVVSVDFFGNVRVLLDEGLRVETFHGLLDAFRPLTERELFEERKARKIEGFSAGQVFFDEEKGQFFVLTEKDPDGHWTVQDLDSYGNQLGEWVVAAEVLAEDVLYERVCSFGKFDLKDPKFRFDFMKEVMADEYGMPVGYKRKLDEVIWDCATVSKGQVLDRNGSLINEPER